MSQQTVKMPSIIEAQLPGGLWCDGPGPLRHVPIRPVGPEDELFLLNTADEAPGPRATALLARCLGDADGSLTGSLTIGDREALLLQLRACSLGDTLEAVVHCPEPACRAALEFRIRVGELLLPPYDNVRHVHQLEQPDDDTGKPVSFRLPRVGDIESALAEAPDDPAAARELQLTRCVDGEFVLAEGALDHLSEAMADLDPQAELLIQLTCTECGEDFRSVLDTGAFLIDELDAMTDQLVWEVYQLASHYHWSEEAILSMPAGRRARYLALLDHGAAAETTTFTGLDDLAEADLAFHGTALG